jgi:hypothetical protein
MSTAAIAQPKPSPTITIIVPQMFRLADKLRIQQERIRERQYRNFAVLTTIVMERQLSTKGISQAKPRWANPEQAKIFAQGKAAGADVPFSEWQANAWVNLTLDWLGKNGPRLAISTDKNDLLLPSGLLPLPKIPDPCWVPKKAGDIAPRVEQDLGSRASGRIYDRTGKMFLLFHPLTELCVLVGGQGGGFGKIKCITDPATKLLPSLLINPDPIDRHGNLEAYFASGAFQAA